MAGQILLINFLISLGRKLPDAEDYPRRCAHAELISRATPVYYFSLHIFIPKERNTTKYIYLLQLSTHFDAQDGGLNFRAITTTIQFQVDICVPRKLQAAVIHPSLYVYTVTHYQCTNIVNSISSSIQLFFSFVKRPLL